MPGLPSWWPARRGYSPTFILHFTHILIIMFSYDIQEVLAQAPVNDVISWPSGMLLLASVLYAALGSSPQRLFEVEPLTGLFLFSGLPLISIPTMRKVNWVSTSAHFVSRIRTAMGRYNFWIRGEDVSIEARKEGLEKVMRVLHCVVFEDRQDRLDEKRWRKTSAGMILPTLWAEPQSPPIITIDNNTNKPPPPPSDLPRLTTHDVLLWAAIEYHVFHEWEVEIYSSGSLIYTTKAKPASTVVDVDSVESAIPVVAAQMVRRPFSQTTIRQKATRPSEREPYVLQLDDVDLDSPACYIDFHSYTPEKHKVSASLRELARAYYTVVQYIKQEYPKWSTNQAMANSSSSLAPSDTECPLARVHVGQSLWISILGGEVFDKGRLTIQNLPGRWGCARQSADEMYLSRITTILEILSPYANTPAFGDLVFSGGLSRRTAIPFLIAGMVGQILICYFISVATTAGVWMSVALANVLYAGRLTDWHSMWLGKTPESEEPGFKMYVPEGGSKALMCIATLDRTTPRQGDLRQGFLLNLFGLVAAILGAIFTIQTRESLGFDDSQPTRPWVVFASIGLSLGTSLLITVTIVLQQTRERTWFDDALLPTRWMVLCTVPASLLVSGLGLWLQIIGKQQFWPILDALVWLSGVPLGMLENGRMISTDDNTLHLVLLNRWIMGAVASSLGSAVA